MRVDSAVALINTVIYKPGWTIHAEDHTARYEDTVKVRIDYPAFSSNREDVKEGEYVEPIPTTYASFPLMVGDCDDVGIYFAIIEVIVAIETHEAREFLRVQPTMWAPFHPHRKDGMKRWADLTGEPMRFDLQFGIG